MDIKEISPTSTMLASAILREAPNLLEIFRRNKIQNGVFVFDIAELGQVSASRPRMRYAEGKDWAIQLKVGVMKFFCASLLLT